MALNRFGRPFVSSDATGGVWVLAKKGDIEESKRVSEKSGMNDLKEGKADGIFGGSKVLGLRDEKKDTINELSGTGDVLEYRFNSETSSMSRQNKER